MLMATFAVFEHVQTRTCFKVAVLLFTNYSDMESPDLDFKTLFLKYTLI